MAKPRSACLAYLVYLAARLVVCIVQSMPVALAWSFARLIAWILHRVDRRHRLVAADNLRHAFPYWDEQTIQPVVRKPYDHFALMLIEMMLMPRKYHRSNIWDIVSAATPQDLERTFGMLRSGRPLLAVFGHFGNWEAFGYAVGLAGFYGAIVARRLDNPHLQRFFQRFRVATGQTILDKKNDFDLILKTLTDRKILGLVGDQDAGPRGLFVQFFGRPASTFKSISLLSLQHSAPILVFGCWRPGVPLYYHWQLADVILPEDFDNDPNAARRITERYTKALEGMIRRHPEQYFWLHRRWKHQPMARKARQAA